jgi:hypothetical protein
VNRARDAAAATAAYAALTIAFTWPLGAGLARDVPSDFGDPLLNAWILAWDATHLGRGWWNANIFHPHPLALAYSEHLLPQAIQILPVYALTKNPILCYNLLFLSTFVLSGLGMFLLARELTGSRAAAFVAGLGFAFAPYRTASLPHLQVLSSAWMPFALLGFRRYFEAGRWRSLAGGSTAWVAQNLSCGYYLLFFSPVILFYIGWELVSRRAGWRMLVGVASALACVALVTAPFAIPYLQLRQLGFGPRPIAEIERFSADVYAYFTADENLRVLGSVVRAWPKAEGSLFPGFTVVALTVLALWRAFQARVNPPRPSAKVESLALLAACAIVLVPLLGIRLPIVKITSVSRATLVAAIVVVIVLAWSRDARRAVASWLQSPVGFFTLAALFAIAMSFGPVIHARGRVVAQPGIYAAFSDWVPGFDGIRVPARFAMIVTLCLASIAAFAIRTVQAAAIAGILMLIESLAVPIPVNANSTDYTQPHLAPLPARVSIHDAEQLYAYVSQLPDGAVLLELPLGEPAFDVRYMFYSTRHWKPLVNGYSGGMPEDYNTLNFSLQDALDRPDRAWQALLQSGATHVVVHEAFYEGGRGPAIDDWLRSRGAQELASFGGDHVLQIRHSN